MISLLPDPFQFSLLELQHEHHDPFSFQPRRPRGDCHARPHRAAGAGTISIVFATLDFAVMLGYAFIGARAIRLLKASAVRWIDRLCGSALLGLAGSLAFYRRAMHS